MIYNFEIKDSLLVFRTTSFKAEKGSILHSGIYNREMASSLAAGACLALSGFFFAGRHKLTAVHFLLALFVFAVLFLLFRTYVFRETVLCTSIDNANGVIEISSADIFGKNIQTFPLAELDGIREDYVSFSPENPDGVKIVESIALQHGTVIPGFGKTAEFYTVELEFKDGRRQMVFSSKAPAAANEVASKFKNYLRGNNA